VLLAWIMVRCAWIGDDAYISFRVVDNFHGGHGLRWNAGERVWVSTHPLMLLCLLGLHAVTRESYLTCMLLSLGASILAVEIVLLRLAPRSPAMILAAAMLATSKAFVDYATSGLENCLSYLLLAAFYVLALGMRRGDERRFLGVALAGGLSLLNRMDLVLLELPVLLWALWRQRGRRSWILLGAGLAPFVAWEVFALVYYGTLVPNTYYAKLAAGIPKAAVALHGVLYYAHSLWSDPLTLASIVTVLAVAFRTGRAVHRLAGCGIALYMIYAFWVNDFMSGRFFAVPMFCSVMLLCALFAPGLVRCGRAAALVVALLLLITSAVHPLSPLRSSADYDLGRIASQRGKRGGWGVTDERAYYYPVGGLLRAGWSGFGLDPIVRGVGAPGADSTATVRVEEAIGFRGYYAGPGIHFVDPLGLGDLLLARLPARLDIASRPGHFVRVVPTGYLDTLRDGTDRLADPGISRLYAALRCVACDPLWTRRRWEAIWKLHTGQYRSLIDVPRYEVASAAHLMELEIAPFRRRLQSLHLADRFRGAAPRSTTAPPSALPVGHFTQAALSAPLEP
jgi:arabinofuranosyltransferase